MNAHFQVCIRTRFDIHRLSCRIAIAVCLAVELTGSSSFAAEIYPSRPVRLVVPFPPGGGTDFVARTLAQVVDVVGTPQTAVEFSHWLSMHPTGGCCEFAWPIRP